MQSMRTPLPNLLDECTTGDMVFLGWLYLCALLITELQKIPICFQSLFLPFFSRRELVCCHYVLDFCHYGVRVCRLQHQNGFMFLLFQGLRCKALVVCLVGIVDWKVETVDL